MLRGAGARFLRGGHHALLSSALRGAACATGNGIVGLGFWWIQHP
ncbi:hypothetical protein [Streptomyces sp. NPDC014734]